MTISFRAWLIWRESVDRGAEKTTEECWLQAECKQAEVTRPRTYHGNACVFA